MTNNTNHKMLINIYTFRLIEPISMKAYIVLYQYLLSDQNIKWHYIKLTVILMNYLLSVFYYYWHFKAEWLIYVPPALTKKHELYSHSVSYDLKIDSNCFPKQHWAIGLYNGDAVFPVG
jgi:hypothetical protein